MVATGAPEEIMKAKQSHTERYLKQHLAQLLGEALEVNHPKQGNAAIA